MAKIAEIDEEAWNKWVSTRPVIIQELCRKYPPDRLYLLKPTGQRATIVSYSEDRSITVNITGDFNCHIFDREVFGIKPEDLEECDLPDDNDILGAALSDPKDVDDYIRIIKNVDGI